jgi:thiol-disulfide isomerase/thioredoxin
MKKIIGVLIVAAIIIGASWWLLSDRWQPTLNDQNTQYGDTSLNDNANTSTLSTEAGDRYVEYTSESFAAAAGKRRVLFFYASWCPICRPADAEFQTEQDQIPSDVTIIRVNYNDSDTDQEEKNLAQQYGVTYQHTFVQIDGDGNTVATWNGGKLDELLKHIK